MARPRTLRTVRGDAQGATVDACEATARQHVASLLGSGTWEFVGLDYSIEVRSGADNVVVWGLEYAAVEVETPADDEEITETWTNARGGSHSGEHCPSRHPVLTTTQCDRELGHEGSHLYTSSTDGRSVDW